MTDWAERADDYYQRQHEDDNAFLNWFENNEEWLMEMYMIKYNLDEEEVSEVEFQQFVQREWDERNEP